MKKTISLHRRKRRGTARNDENCGFWPAILSGLLTAVSVGLLIAVASAAALMATPDPLAYAKLFAAGILFAAGLIGAYVSVRKSGKAASGIVAGAILSLIFFAFAVFSSNVKPETAFIVGGMILFSLLGTLAGRKRKKA